MNEQRILHFQDKLTALRDALENSGKIKAEPNRDSPTEKTDDDHQPLNEMLQTIASSRNKNHAQTLALISAALDTLARYPDEYGLCEDCEEPIAQKRLELMPYAQYCVGCQSAKEGDKQPGRRRHLTDYNA